MLTTQITRSSDEQVNTFSHEVLLLWFFERHKRPVQVLDEEQSMATLKALLPMARFLATA
jgi:hypothetical protein